MSSIAPPPIACVRRSRASRASTRAAHRALATALLMLLAACGGGGGGSGTDASSATATTTGATTATTTTTTTTTTTAGTPSATVPTPTSSASATTPTAGASTTPPTAATRCDFGAKPIGVVTHWALRRESLASPAPMAAAGFTSVRDELFWADVEKIKGQYALPAYGGWVDLANGSGLLPLLVLDYGNPLYGGGKPQTLEAIDGFARYAEWVVRLFGNRLRMVEIWNEWDLGIGGGAPGTAQAYAELLKTVVPRLRAANPSACLLAGSVSTATLIGTSFVQTLLKAGLLDLVDGLSVHRYDWTERDTSPEAWRASLLALKASIEAASGKPMALWVTESGWPVTSVPQTITAQTQADFAQRLFLLAGGTREIKGVWLYDWRNDGIDPADPEQNFGVVDAAGNPKPAFTALREQNAMLAGMAFDRWLADRTDLIVGRWRASSDELHALWSPTGTVTVSVAGKAPGMTGATAQASAGCRIVPGVDTFTVRASATPCLLKAAAGTLVPALP